MTYQGSLMHPWREPVEDGVYRMQFKLYDGVTTGSNLWQQTSNVEVVGGLFSVVLGEATPMRPVFLHNAYLWLEVTVDTDRSGSFEPQEVYKPRQRLNSEPWSASRLLADEYRPNLIAGHENNRILAGVRGATISGGGGLLGVRNQVTDHGGTVAGGGANWVGNDNSTLNDADYGTVSGGYANHAPGSHATISGGYANRAWGNSASVGGGSLNETNASYTTIAGGRRNLASGSESTIGGGRDCVTTGMLATVPGGLENHAAGNYSFAAGHRAHAMHMGAMVLSDSRYPPTTSTAGNQFMVRATGGVVFITQIDGQGNPTKGVQLPTGATSWLPLPTPSDRDRKENFEEVDPREILERVRAMPILSWNYDYEDPSIRHIGPMAQDFHAAFAMGKDNRHIDTVDADGVAMAAIQGLCTIVREKDAEIAEQGERIAELQSKIKALRSGQAELTKRLAAIEALLTER
jgi:hypothetical protein